MAEVKSLFWSRAPGRIVNKWTGEEALSLPNKVRRLVPVFEKEIHASPRTMVQVLQEQEVDEPRTAPVFHGTIREWYESLTETILDASNLIFKSHLQVPDIIEVSGEGSVLRILETLNAFKIIPKEFGELTVRGSEGVLAGILCDKFRVLQVPNLDKSTIKVVLVSNVEMKAEKSEHPIPNIQMRSLVNPVRLAEQEIRVLDLLII